MVVYGYISSKVLILRCVTIHRSIVSGVIVKILIVLTVALFLLNIVQAGEDFECIQTNCSYFDVNETGKRLWSCDYINCSSKPYWTEEIIYYNITNCTPDVFYEHLDEHLENFTGAVERSFNLSEQLVDCKMSRDSFRMQSDECGVNLQERDNYISSTCMDRDIVNARYQQYESNVTVCYNQVSQEVFRGYLKIGGGFIACYAMIWWFKLRRPSVEKTEVMPATGETPYDSRLIDIDTKLAQADARQDAKRKADTDRILAEINKIKWSQPKRELKPASRLKPAVKTEAEERLKSLEEIEDEY